MDRNERELFRYLCNLRTEDYDDELLKYASAEVLGELFINRMQGVAYYILKRRQQLSKVTREFRNSLEIAYENNVRKNEGYFLCSYVIEYSNPKKKKGERVVITGKRKLSSEFNSKLESLNVYEDDSIKVVILSQERLEELSDALLNEKIKKGQIFMFEEETGVKIL